MKLSKSYQLQNIFLTLSYKLKNHDYKRNSNTITRSDTSIKNTNNFYFRQNQNKIILLLTKKKKLHWHRQQNNKKKLNKLRYKKKPEQLKNKMH